MSDRHRQPVQTPVPAPDQAASQAPRQLDCAFCGYSIPQGLAPVGVAGHSFCSEPCREAFENGQEPFEGGLGFKRRPVGVAALQPALPQGVPANSALLFAGEEGTRRDGLVIEWLWRELDRGGPAVVLCADEPPSGFVDRFLAHGWNVLPYLHRRQLVLVDLFTGRLEEESTFSKRANRWTGFVEDAFDRGFVRLRDPSDLGTVSNQLDDTLEDLEGTASAVVAIDSLTELASFTQEVQVLSFLKEIRAIVCKSRYVPLLATASVPREDDGYPTDFPHDHEYLFDGIVDLELDEDRFEGRRVDRLSVRKLDDVLVVSDWIDYEFAPDVGYVPVGPSASRAAGSASERRRPQSVGSSADHRHQGSDRVAGDGERSTDGSGRGATPAGSSTGRTARR